MEKNRLKIIRDDLGGISQLELSNITGIPQHKIRYAETSRAKISQEIAGIISQKLDYNSLWILTGEGPMKTVEPTMSAEKTFSEPPRHPVATLMPSPDASPPGIDPAIQAMADIKEIFDSGDPILVPAIQANLNAFKRALLRERQFAQVIQENKDLKERLTKLEKVCGELPNLKRQIEDLKAENIELRKEVNRLKATYEAPNGGDGHLAATSKEAM